MKISWHLVGPSSLSVHLLHHFRRILFYNNFHVFYSSKTLNYLPSISVLLLVVIIVSLFFSTLFCVMSSNLSPMSLTAFSENFILFLLLLKCFFLSSKWFYLSSFSLSSSSTLLIFLDYFMSLLWNLKSYIYLYLYWEKDKIHVVFLIMENSLSRLFCHTLVNLFGRSWALLWLKIYIYVLQFQWTCRTPSFLIIIHL